MFIYSYTRGIKEGSEWAFPAVLNCVIITHLKQSKNGGMFIKSQKGKRGQIVSSAYHCHLLRKLKVHLNGKCKALVPIKCELHRKKDWPFFEQKCIEDRSAWGVGLLGTSQMVSQAWIERAHKFFAQDKICGEWTTTWFITMGTKASITHPCSSLISPYLLTVAVVCLMEGATRLNTMLSDEIVNGCTDLQMVD